MGHREILQLFEDNAETGEMRRVLAARPQAASIQQQAPVDTAPLSDVQRVRRLRGKQAGCNYNHDVANTMFGMVPDVAVDTKDDDAPGFVKNQITLLNVLLPKKM